MSQKKQKLLKTKKQKQTKKDAFQALEYGIRMSISGLSFYKNSPLAEFITPIIEFFGADNLNDIEEKFAQSLDRRQFNRQQRNHLNDLFISFKQSRCLLSLPTKNSQPIPTNQLQIPNETINQVNQQIKDLNNQI